MDTEILARIQFAFTIAFHYIYPPLSIGLGVILVIMEGMYLRTKKEIYHTMTRFWVKIFALIFGIGVATGIVMEFEFGTNWATYSRYVGDIFGSALAAEGLFAFALESGFLGILLFGWNRVKPWVHFVSTIGVAFGSMFSAVWIVVANSWQQTPAGFKIVGEGMNQKAEITDFWAMVFNPSSVDRLSHVLIGAFLAGAFLVISVNAYYILKGRYLEIAKPAFKIALVVVIVASFAQLFTGHRSADGVAEYQPAKLAAFEGHYDSLAVGDMYLFGWVDHDNKEVTGLKIPKFLTFLIHQDFTTQIKGLDYFPEDEIPGQVNAVFQFYHIMVAIGMVLIGLSILSIYLWWKGKLFKYRWFLVLMAWAVFLPQIANQVGWFAAEMGRQPWVVYGLLRTDEAFSQAVTANQILFTLILFFFVYLLLFVLFIYLLNKKIKHGPYDDRLEDDRPNQSEQAFNL
ncbi:cytochrome bd-I ubiquinol oxidase subunit 1 apoprotein [Roseivirga ehrenbergii]|uniref:Cytochrome D ubiquinol oxidase subunit I n=1 Tax=Roseivirga ehrenbergii (strain DSM 102268 / JCM 13514 / KCTC 12282 / NCIMB 14502 / KMM 6017) TaxID=279360 RepID=A0A150X0N7_ROSEK|nr:cytochrome ubiquinol oxidase subunit I [Roseivirga ehrenbergii]KYG72291.1 cytochrome D ubiquinol oxidase subunit I [Roseivirga ehrenbergii]TCL13535.1 cytochrome bd-I ubiquinol oxidase subunit 1 apoprotein [Roseivirga ehrenbergii]